MLCAIPYFENSNKSIFYDLKKRAKNNYVMNKAEFLSTVAAVQNLLLNFRHNYNSYMQSQFNDISNKLMFAQHGKTGYDEGEKKTGHITFNYCG